MTSTPTVIETPAELGAAVPRLDLDEAERLRIEEVLDEAASRWTTVEDPEFQAEAAVLAHELPRRLRSFLTAFRLHEPDEAYCVIGGYRVDDRRIGTTPSHWKLRAERSPALHEELFLVIAGSLLGEAIAWSTQQDGFLVHDVLPIAQYKDEQLGIGSEQTLLWHTEDAFHPYRGDYLALLCLRNPDGVATTIAVPRRRDLSPEQVDLLFQPRFSIRPDGSHQPSVASEHRAANPEVEAAFARIEELNRRARGIPVLFGDRETPYVCLDPVYMDEPEDEPAKAALATLVDGIERNLVEVVVQPGELLVVDNYRAVHGRRAFSARYDGRDRWLKRINIVRDLRKSRDSRRAAASRTIY